MADEELEQESTASATWSRLLAGNRRFAEGESMHPWQDKEARKSLIDQQNPDAAVLCCSDSRVPPEIIFDARLGDMCTVRTAGQMLDDAALASLEYAVSDLGVSLLVILGHQGCGAIELGMKEYDAFVNDLAANTNDALETADSFDNLNERITEAESVVLRSIGLSIWQAREAELDSRDDFERVHVARTIEDLVTRSEVLQRALASDRLMIVGARYQLTDGKVEVLSF